MKKIYILIFPFLFAGCISTNVPPVPPTAQLETPSITREITETVTPTNTPDPTWTPLPTFSQEESQARIVDMINGSEECQLPCFGGLTPGETSWDQAMYLVQPLRMITIFNIYENFECIFGNCNNITWGYFFSSGVNVSVDIVSVIPEEPIQLISVQIGSANLAEGLRLNNVLSTYGRPDVILMGILPYMVMGPEMPDAAMTIVLSYVDEKFMIVYHYSAKEKDGLFTSCDQAGAIHLQILNNSSILSSLGSMAEATETSYLINTEEFKIIEEAMSDTTLNSFYENYLDQNSQCISTPIDNWRHY